MKTQRQKSKYPNNAPASVEILIITATKRKQIDGFIINNLNRLNSIIRTRTKKPNPVVE